jgi:hypothetical protein
VFANFGFLSVAFCGDSEKAPSGITFCKPQTFQLFHEKVMDAELFEPARILEYWQEIPVGRDGSTALRNEPISSDRDTFCVICSYFQATWGIETKSASFRLFADFNIDHSVSVRS